MRTALEPQAALDLRDVAASDPWETIRRARRLISRKVGVIRQITEVCHQAQDPAVFVTSLGLSDFSRCWSGGVNVAASGAGDSAAAALAAAIGEAAERYCMSWYDPESLVLGTYRELADEAVAPDLLRLFSREQVDRFGPSGPSYFDERSRIRWVRGYSLSTRRPRLVPASFVYFKYRPGSDEVFIGRSASTGAAAGATREEAILSGLAETVERDAFTLSWMRRQPGRRIDIDDEELRELVARHLRASRPGVDVKFFDITIDVNIPVVFGVMRRPSEMGPALCLGLAARLRPDRAVRKCVYEMAQTFVSVRGLLARETDWQPAADFSNLRSFEHHFETYVKRPELVPAAFAFYDTCQERVALSALSDRSTGRVLGDIDCCVAALDRAGYEAIVVDITTEDVAAAGLSVVRVIVPGLVPLHHNHGRPYLGVRRLAAGEGGLSAWPHPFP